MGLGNRKTGKRHEAGQASEDYPELEEVLEDRPPLEHDIERMGRMGLSMVAKKIDPETREALADRPNMFDWVMNPVETYVDRFNEELPERLKDQGAGRAISTGNWCRFRSRRSRCMFPRDIDMEGTKQAGYPVWFPVDRGFCPYESDEMQESGCPVSEPGPDSGHPEAKVRVTKSWAEGGQRKNSSLSEPQKKESFKPPSRFGPQPTWLTDMLRDKLVDEGGYSFSRVLRLPKGGYMVSIYPEFEKVIPEPALTHDVIESYINDHAQVLGQRDNYLGGWMDEGMAYLDVARHTHTREEAIALAIEHDQLAVFDLNTFDTIYVEDSKAVAAALQRWGKVAAVDEDDLTHLTSSEERAPLSQDALHILGD